MCVWTCRQRMCLRWASTALLPDVQLVGKQTTVVGRVRVRVRVVAADRVRVSLSTQGLARSAWLMISRGSCVPRPNPDSYARAGPHSNPEPDSNTDRSCIPRPNPNAGRDAQRRYRQRKRDRLATSEEQLTELQAQIHALTLDKVHPFDP